MELFRTLALVLEFRMDNPRLVGHIVAVQGFRVKVELLPETRSALRATPDGVQAAIAINAYLTFSLGAGETVIGIITDLEARETFDPNSGDDLSLELMKPRRIASVQLLGTVEHAEDEPSFGPGISVLPTLDTPAEIGSPHILRAIFEVPPRRNRPEDYDDKGFDCDLKIGFPTGQARNVVRASYNDLFSRPLAIVGNTGSGKSFSVSSLIQKAMKALDGSAEEPHIFVLDINGEYGRAFPSVNAAVRSPDRVYLNGKEFGLPIWFMNAEEICAWLSAAEQAQEPVLKDWWAIAKGRDAAATTSTSLLQGALSALDHLLKELTQIKRMSAGAHCDAITGYLSGTDIETAAFEALFMEHRAVEDNRQLGWNLLANQADILVEANELKEHIRSKIGDTSSNAGSRTADSPLPITRATLADPSLINRAVSKEDALRVDAHLTTLKLRLRTRLDDRRWRAFLNYEDAGTRIENLSAWFGQFGLGVSTGPKVSVLDLSMLSSEVLPYACAVIGRVLLEARECLPAALRYKHPWVLVLEEAHNYARPARSDEDRGHRLARLTYERIAKEGRKFGLSLIIASQRPSEISQTIISQCANFISHRLQNPDDIDHFRRIIPMQARRLLDQVTILSSGEAIVFGSAFHIPARVQFDRPEPSPYSQTAAPYYEWTRETEPFPLAQVCAAWGV